MASKVKLYKSKDYDCFYEDTSADSKYSTHMNNSESSTESETECSVNNESTFGKRFPTKNGGTVRNSSRISKNNSQIQRLPTRCPNPKISNRNALLARENRRRKKEMYDKLEKELENLMAENKKIKKLMKIKDENILRLDKERSYLKSVIANKTDIVRMLRSFRSSNLPITSSLSSFSTHNTFDNKLQHDSDCYSTTSSAMHAMSPNYKANDSLNISDENTDFIDIPHSTVNRWDNNFTNIDKNFNFVEDISKLKDGELLAVPEINSEHNYSDAGQGSDAGVCFHISNGRVSLEFCAECHQNSENAWEEEM